MNPLKIDLSSGTHELDGNTTQELEICETSTFIVQSPVATMTKTDRFRSYVSSSPLVSMTSTLDESSHSGSLIDFSLADIQLAETAAAVGSTETEQDQTQSSSLSQPIKVKETLDATITETTDGHLRLKQYVLLDILGQGAYGIVNLGEDINTKTKYAIKEFSKSKLSKKVRASAFRYGRGRGRPDVVNNTKTSPLDMIKSEIAILKKLNHVNIVKLHEVLDVANADSMFMVFELCERGVLTEVTVGDKIGKIFEDEECRDVFHQIILGIEYLHDHDIIHRDIKPDNLLRSADGTLKIVDFGVSEMFSKKGDDVTKKSAGSPAFMAPEWCRYDHGELSGKPGDVWSMGVTLFCMKYGRLPFRSSSSFDLQRVIREEEPDTSEETDPRFKHVMQRLLDKDPATRITLDELRIDPWVTDDGKKPLKGKDENTENAVVELTPDDLQHAIQSVYGLATVLKAASKFKSLLKSHSREPSSNEGEEQEVDGVKDENNDKPMVTSSPAMLSLRFKGGRDKIVKPETPKEANLEEKVAGFPVCDMETGICYYE